MKKLFVQNEDGSMEQVSAVAFGENFKSISKTSVENAIQKYIECCTSNKCEKNQKSEKLYFDKILTYLKAKKVFFIDEVTREHIDQFESILLKKIKVSSVNRRFNTFKNFFVKCKEWKMILENPCEGKKKRREEKNRRKAWSKEDFSKFIRLCSGIRKKILLFLWITGCRPMEVKNLKWTDVNYDSMEITLRCGKSYNGGQSVVRKFPMTPEIDRLLHSMKIDSQYVFSENRQRLNNDTLYQYCKKRLKALGLENHTPYGIRHGFGTRLARKGVSAFYIAELMGHSKLETTKEYVESEKKQLIDIVSRAI